VVAYHSLKRAKSRSKGGEVNQKWGGNEIEFSSKGTTKQKR
jgi:hypothetical protein